MNLKTYVSDFIAENPFHYEQGNIHTHNIYTWVMSALSIFGNNLAEIQAVTLDVVNFKAHLPKDFISLRYAVKCSPVGYSTSMDKNTLFSVSQWVERTERGRTWDSCDPCCREESEKVITEKVYIKGKGEIEYYMDRPTLLTVERGARKYCAAGCLNLTKNQSEYTIDIVRKTVHTNFESGVIFAKYFGLPQDDEGIPIIPDAPQDVIFRYVDAYVYMKFYEYLLRNKSDSSIITLYKLYRDTERELRMIAPGIVAGNLITKEVLNKVKDQARRKMRTYELNFEIFD